MRYDDLELAADRLALEEMIAGLKTGFFLALLVAGGLTLRAFKSDTARFFEKYEPFTAFIGTVLLAHLAVLFLGKLNQKTCNAINYFLN